MESAEGGEAVATAKLAAGKLRGHQAALLPPPTFVPPQLLPAQLPDDLHAMQRHTCQNHLPSDPEDRFRPVTLSNTSLVVSAAPRAPACAMLTASCGREGCRLSHMLL